MTYRFYFLFSKFFIFFLFSTSYFLFSARANAASFSVSPQELTLRKEAAVVLSVDTEDQEINAIQLRLKFSPDDFLIKDISDGNSIISLWIDKPNFLNPPARLDSSEAKRVGGRAKGEIYFSGIIPGGFQGANGQLLKIILITQNTGEASFETSEAKVLLNDGKGTEAKLNLNNFKFNIAEVGLSQEIGLQAKDTEPPELFSPQIASDSDTFGGKYFLVFATQDKGSGVDYYAIHESTRTKESARIATNEWVAAESPYLLKDQKLQSYIYVKAVDKAGNERFSEIPPQNPAIWYENLIYAIIILTLLMVIAAYIFWRKLCVKKTHE